MGAISRSNQLVAAVVGALLICLTLSQVALAAHAVRAHGSGQINQTWGVDFDGGVFNGNSYRREDMQFDAISQNERYLNPEGASRIRKMGSAMPSYGTCANTAMNQDSINVNSFPIATWFCFKTKPGRFARFRVDDIHSNPGPITITFTTWEF